MTIQEKSADMRLLEQLLIAVPVKGLIRYDELQKHFPERDFRGKHRGFLIRGMRNVCRDEGVVFDCEQRVGYRRQDDVGKAEGTTAGLTRARRIVRNHVIARARAVENPAALPLATRTVMFVNASVGAALAYVTKTSTLKKFGQGSGANPATLPPIETLRKLAQGKKAQ